MNHEKQSRWSNSKNVSITVARGDGIGPEIMDATLKVLDAAGARFDGEPGFSKGQWQKI